MLDFVPLAFGIETLHPPMELPDRQIREFYVGLADPCRFNEFKHLGPQHGARMAESKNRFLQLTNDRVIFRDEFTQQTFSTSVRMWRRSTAPSATHSISPFFCTSR